MTKAVKLVPWLSHIELLKPNRMEAAALTGRPEDSPVEDLANALHDLGVKRVVISQGQDGVWGSDAVQAVDLWLPPDRLTADS